MMTTKERWKDEFVASKLILCLIIVFALFRGSFGNDMTFVCTSVLNQMTFNPFMIHTEAKKNFNSNQNDLCLRFKLKKIGAKIIKNRLNETK